MQDQQSTPARDLPTALSGPVRILRDAVASLEAGLAGDVHVHSITASLISTWRLIERDPGFEVAAADLLAAARHLASPGTPRARRDRCRPGSSRCCRPCRHTWFSDGAPQRDIASRKPFQSFAVM